HPAVWWISKRLSLEREIACDDYVLQSSAQPHAYALLLANLAARLQRCPPLLAPGASNNKTQLQQRIDMILNTRRNTSPRLAAPPATPKPAAIGPGPKLKPGHSRAVPGQPSVEPAPPAPAVLVAPAVPVAPAPLTAQSAPLMSPGSILLSAAPAPEPRPGRTP